MAARYWVGGTGNWNDTAHWAASSGGAGGQALPTTADDVFLDGNSGGGTLTTTSGTTCRSLDCTGYTGTLNLAVFIQITTSVNAVIKLSPTMTVSGGATLNISVGGGTTTTLTTYGKAIPNVNYGGAATGTLLLGDALTVTTALTFTSGIFDTNSQAITAGQFNLVNTAVARVATLGSSAITITGTGSCFNWPYITNLTITANTATITFTGAAPILQVGNFNYAFNIVFQSAAQGEKRIETTSGALFVGGPTFKNLTFIGAANKGEILALNWFTGLTITGTLTITGNSAINRVLVTGYQAANYNVGVTVTVTAAAVSLSNVDFTDIGGAGAAAPFTGTSLGDALGNSGIAFPASVNRYWVGGTGNWTDPAHWSASSGGAGGATAPLPQDDVFLNASSGGGTLTADALRWCRNLDMTGFTGTLIWTIAANLFGNLTVPLTGGSYSNNGNLSFRGRGQHTIQSGQRFWGYTHLIDTPTGTYTLLNHLTGNGVLQFNKGNFDANGFNVSLGAINFSQGYPRTIRMGSGTWTVSLSGTCWNVANLNRLTLDPGTSTILITDASAAVKTFLGGGLAYNILRWLTGGTGSLSILGDNSFNELDVQAPVNQTLLLAGRSGGTAAACNLIHRALTLKGAGGVLTVSAVSAGYGVTFNLDPAATLDTANASLSSDIRIGRGIVGVSGGEITDVTRKANIEGDNRPPESSYGIWEGITNYLLNGGFETGTADWDSYQSGSILVNDANERVFGSQSLKVTRVPAAANWGLSNSGRLTFGSRLPAAVVGDKYTFSCYLKATPGFVGKNLRVILRLRGGALGFNDVSQTFPLTSSWQRYTWTTTVDATDRTGIDNFLIQGDLVDNEGFWIDGAQLERVPSTSQALATPYRHTDGAVALRPHGRVQAPSNVIAQPQFWWAARIRIGFPYDGVTARRLLSWRDISSGGGTEIQLAANGAWNMGDVVNAQSGSSSGAIGWGTGHLPGEKHTIAGFATAAQLGISVDGSVFTKAARSHALGLPLGVSQTFEIGHYGPSATLYSSCDFFWVACGKGVLSDADAATLYALGDTTPQRATLPAASQTTFIWDADDPDYASWLWGVGPLGVVEPTYKVGVLDPVYAVGGAEPAYATSGAEPTYTVGALEERA